VHGLSLSEAKGTIQTAIGGENVTTNQMTVLKPLYTGSFYGLMVPELKEARQGGK
jgi:hypothetical protein